MKMNNALQRTVHYEYLYNVLYIKASDKVLLIIVVFRYDT